MDDECESLAEKARYYDYHVAYDVAQERSKRINRPIYVYPCGQHFHLTKKKRSAKQTLKDAFTRGRYL